MDLFGDIDDISSESDEDQQAPTPRQPVTCVCHSQSTAGTFGVSWKQQVERSVFETRVKIAVPSINSDLGNELYFVKLPRFLRIDPNMSLHLGKEVYDICKTPLQDNRNHLFIREDTGLRGQAIFQSRLTFRPYCRDSATYKKMTLSFGNRSSKTQIRILPMADHDPEWLCPDLIKMQRKELRVSTPRKVRLRRKSRRQKRQQRPGRSSTIQKPNLVVEEEEEVEGEDEEGKASSEVATKSRYQGAAKKKQAMSSSDCYRERPGEEKARGLLKAKRFESDRGDKPSRRRQRRKRRAEM